MQKSGNKGEWSELYAFFKLLAEGRLYSADGETNRYEDRFYPILKIFRDDKVDRNEYTLNTAKNNILIVGENINVEIPQSVFEIEAERLLNEITKKKEDSNYEDTISFMKRVGTDNIKAKSKDKADIRIVIHNLHTGFKPELGYSIKSKLGGASTLINANKNATNFTYEVKGINETDADNFNSCSLFKDKIKVLRDVNAAITYVGTASSVIHKNLLMLDMGLETILSDMLLFNYEKSIHSIKEVCEEVSKINSLNLPTDICSNVYAYKIKQFLLAFALGMTPADLWDGKFNANGGYIVVKEDGEIVCYHFFDRNDLEDYLFYNTCFETPSTKRHEFGKIFKEDDKWFFNLNLQVRFKD